MRPSDHTSIAASIPLPDQLSSGNPKWFENLGVPKETIPAELYAAYAGFEGTGRGDHNLNGPIAIRGAEPSDMLEIRIRSVDVRPPIAGQGFVPNRGELPEDFPYEKSRVLWLDLDRETVEYVPGVEVPLRRLLKGEIQVVLHKGRRLTWPRAETPTHFITMGLHADLDGSPHARCSICWWRRRSCRAMTPTCWPARPWISW